MKIPSKIVWKIDLRTGEEMLWSQKLLHRLENSRYTNLSCDWLLGEDIERVFLPIYCANIMSRADFRLDKKTTMEKIHNMSHDLSYKLYFVRNETQPIGGLIVRLLDGGEARVAYRTFDHGLAKKFRLEELDYYVEIMLRNELRKLGFIELSHGSDIHPITQIGLSIFKLRIGARPCVKEGVEDVEWQNGKHIGYYSDPIDGKYTKFHLIESVRSDLLSEFATLAERAGVNVVVECETSRLPIA